MPLRAQWMVGRFLFPASGIGTKLPTMSIGKKAGQIGAATMLSRVFGLVREQLFAALMGAGFYSDAFVNAFRIPNLLRDLFAEGALSNAFVPTFTEQRIQKSPADAWRLANLVLGALLVVVGTLTLLGIVFAPAVVQLVAPGLGAIEGKRELTVELTRVMMPFLLLVSCAALFMGMLNSYERYALPALAPVLFNGVSIAVGLGIWLQGWDSRRAVFGWAIGTLLAGLAQAFVQIPALHRLGWRVRPALKGFRTDPGLRRIFALMLPAIVANSGTQVNILVNSILASWLEEGSASWLYYAFRIMQLPIGVFGVAISVVTLTESAKLAATGDRDRLGQNLTSSVVLTLILTVPCTLGLLALADPIVRLIYEHGRFDAGDTIATAAAIRYYAVGLAAYSLVKVLAPVLFVFNSARTPMVASLVGIAGNIAFNFATYKALGHRGLALGTSVGVFLNVAILAASLQKRHVRLDLARLAKGTLACLGCATVMAFIARAAYDGIHPYSRGFTGRALDVGVPIALAGAVYFAGLRLLRVPEAVQLWEKLRARLAR